MKSRETQKMKIEDWREILEEANAPVPETPLPWKWEDLEEFEDGYLFAPECSYLEDTLINLGDNYEGHGKDIKYLITSANKYPELLRALNYIANKQTSEEYREEYGDSYHLRRATTTLDKCIGTAREIVGKPDLL